MWRFIKNVPRPSSSGSSAGSCDKTAETAVNKELAKVTSKRKRQTYNKYTAEFRAKVAKYALDNGDARAVRHFSPQLETPINESVVRNWRGKWLAERDASPNPASSSGPSKLEIKPRGRPVLLGQLDKKVQDYVKNIRKSGGVVNRAIVIATARGIVLHHDRTRLAENGGDLELGRGWVESFLSRLGFVTRKGTRAARKRPADFPDLERDFLRRIQVCVAEHKIPNCLIINFDQTGVNVVPTGKYTVEVQGSKQVEITGLDDKRQVTALLSVNLDDDFLPPQILYKGKTEQCHPKYNGFPEDWDVWHSENHWSNTSTMEHFADYVIFPYIEAKKKELGLGEEQHALCIFDVFAAHRTDEFLEKLHNQGISTIFVPASCTPYLQPRDSEGSINDEYKKAIKNLFTEWYSTKVTDVLDAGEDINKDLKVDLRMSALKPLHAKWLVEAFNQLKDRYDIILRGWDQTGIAKAVEEARHPDFLPTMPTDDQSTPTTSTGTGTRNIFDFFADNVADDLISSDDDDDLMVLRSDDSDSDVTIIE